MNIAEIPDNFYGQLILNNNGIVTGYISKRQLGQEYFVAVCVFNAAAEQQHIKFLRPESVQTIRMLDRKTCLEICRREHLASYHL